MLNRVEPLRNELDALESQANENKLKGQEVMKLIADLEKSISMYKEEYALLISQAQAIKTSLSAVELKVLKPWSLPLILAILTRTKYPLVREYA